MARNSSLHIDIPQSALKPHPITRKTAAPESPGYFQPKDESSFSFTRNGSQYLASPSSVTSTSPMMTPVPFQMQNPFSGLTLQPGKEEKKRLNEYEFPAAAAKDDVAYQSYLSHPFTLICQQRPQEQQEQQQQNLLSHQTYASKYASFTNSSHNMIRANYSMGGQKPSTTMALSMIEKEKATFQGAPSNRDSLVSPPPPPYLHSDHGGAPLDSSYLSRRMITPASLALAQSKRNSLPPSSTTIAASISPSPSSSSLSNTTRTAKELKRHSLAVTPSTAAGVQWPSAMTMTMAAVTRPILARTMPPQAIPILYTGDVKSPLTPVTPTTVFTPRTTRLLEQCETDTLYSYKISEDGQASLKSASGSVIASPRTRTINLADVQHAGSPRGFQEQFPGFWKDAKAHHLHWMLFSFGVVAAGSALWLFLMVPALLIWASVLPGVLVLLLGVQYAGYRWRRHRHRKQRKDSQPSEAALNSMRAASVALSNYYSGLRPVPGSSSHHAHRSSLSSMHTSVGSIGSDSFLEPHHPSPPNILKSQFQHQYIRNTSVAGSPTQFAEGYAYRNQHQLHSLSPEGRQSWRSLQPQQGQGNQESLHQNRPRDIQRQESASSIASTETVSSSSTCSELIASTSASPCHPGHHSRSVPVSTLKSPAVAASSTLASLAQRDGSMMPPPPAYVSKKCEEMMMNDCETMSERAVALLGVALPEIAPLGDLLSEFAVDFESIQY